MPFLIRNRRTFAIVERFREAQATSAASARRLAEIGIRDIGELRALLDRFVVREAEPGLYYLDEEIWETLLRRGGLPGCVLVPVIALAIVVAMVLVHLLRIATLRH